MTERVQVGLEVACSDPPPRLQRARRIGLLANQASVDRHFQEAPEVLHERFPGALAALFGPQHGLWSTEQDNMVETAHAQHARLRVPVHSLYSETRTPTAAMLDGLDLFVVDLQDVGTRVYTYVWTLTLCMQACKAAGIPVLVLDRPNPVGGAIAEGPRLDVAFASFVGRAAIPMRHGLTLGELALACNELLGIHADVEVVPMRGWRRSMLWPDTGRAWLPPSPNLPRCEGALVYPGQVLIEGTQLSEGRGTTTPFEQWGAPFVDPWRVREALPAAALGGCTLRPVAFEPTFQKWRAQACRGLWLHVTDAATFRPYRTTLALLRAVREVHGDRFAWLPPPYEYETVHMPIDILTGGTAVRAWVDRLGDWRELDALAAPPADWWPQARRWLLYD